MRTNKLTLIKLFGVVALVSCLSIPVQAQMTGKLSNVQRLTNDGERYVNVQWSPDGSKLAFTKEGFDGIEVIDMATKSRKVVTDAPNSGDRFQWSADGKEILYRHTKWEDGERTHTIHVTDLAGKSQQVSAGQRYLQPASWRYTTAGEKRVLSVDGQIVKQPQIEKLSVAKTKSVLTTRRANLSTFCDENMHLWLIDENGKKTMLNESGLEPAFSPNGQKIVFNEDDYLIVMDLNGRNRRDLGMGFRATWINDNQIVFELTTDDGHHYTGGELYLMNIDGSLRVKLTDTPDRIEMYPTWNEKAQKLAFVSEVDGQIYTADLK
ncbi:MAG: PD40 domain-containing protein [Paludibacteraceae bacterium]|jgi:Tol biopolymer transport system component|nr:PD40 domain-containing protein [Paludibacteraceae bacterium]MDI9537245.1 hypothetical protein [Bacteroidota bacterium]HHT61632.1 hypothetical protein [Bacteroidales bacterium]HOG37116.1 hypothetical protein [Paludibacteraceae bacterium]HOS37990.1 hypothetical protein [Paludibacteraceae bacterium]